MESFWIQLLDQAMQNPTIGHWVTLVVTTVVGAAFTAINVITALMALWHSVILALRALALIPIPALSSRLNALADSLMVSYEKVHGMEDGKVLPFLNRLSAISPPKHPPADTAGG